MRASAPITTCVQAVPAGCSVAQDHGGAEPAQAMKQAPKTTQRTGIRGRPIRYVFHMLVRGPVRLFLLPVEGGIRPIVEPLAAFILHQSPGLKTGRRHLVEEPRGLRKHRPGPLVIDIDGIAEKEVVFGASQ